SHAWRSRPRRHVHVLMALVSSAVSRYCCVRDVYPGRTTVAWSVTDATGAIRRSVPTGREPTLVGLPRRTTRPGGAPPFRQRTVTDESGGAEIPNGRMRSTLPPGAEKPGANSKRLTECGAGAHPPSDPINVVDPIARSCPSESCTFQAHSRPPAWSG